MGRCKMAYFSVLFFLNQTKTIEKCSPLCIFRKIVRIDKVEIVWYHVNVRCYSKWIERWVPM